jgi:hypothetical protein
MSKQGDEPAYPFSKEEIENGMDRGGYAIEKTVLKQYQGLTRREWFAGMTMQGIWVQNSNYYSPKYLVKATLTYVDALLAELERTNGEKKPTMIDAKVLRSKISKLREVEDPRCDPYREGRDDGLCFALDALDDMIGNSNG